MDLGAIIQAVATVVALVGVIVSFALTRRGQNQDLVLAREQADRAERAQKAGEASAERAEAAAALNIDALTRIADALEQPIAGALERSVRIAAEVAEYDRPMQGVGGDRLPMARPARVKWSLRHHSGDRYQLENMGEATAYDVKVTGHESLLQPDEWPSVDQLVSGEALTFIAARTMGTVDSTITVTWSPGPGDEESDTWRYPLPPRPPR